MKAKIKSTLNHYLALILLFISIVFYGVYTGVQKQGLKEIENPFEFAAYTMIFSSLFLLPTAINQIRIKPKLLKNQKLWFILIFLSIATQFVALSLKLFGLKETTATTTGFISSFSSVFLVIYAVVLTREKLPKGFVWVISVMILGLILFRVNDNFEFQFGVGELLILAFINVTSISNALVKNFTKQFSPYLLSFGRMFFAIPFLVAAALLNDVELSLPKLFNFWPILAGFLFAVRNLTLFLAIERTRLQNVAIINILAPVITFSYSFVFLDETLGWIQTLGASIILLGAYLVVKVKQKEKKS